VVAAFDALECALGGSFRALFRLITSDRGYGYYLNKKLIGIIEIKAVLDKIEILHFGVHPEYRGKNLGTELMDYIKDKKKMMVLTTDDDAILFYKNYGYTYTEYYDEKYNGKRYNCTYNQ
jgi:ribosomal protein S18 acetylase RimI-like enzyme